MRHLSLLSTTAANTSEAGFLIWPGGVFILKHNIRQDVPYRHIQKPEIIKYVPVFGGYLLAAVEPYPPKHHLCRSCRLFHERLPTKHTI